MPFLCCFWTILDSGFVLFPCSVSTRKQLPSCWEQLVNTLRSWRKPRLTVAPWTLWWCAWKILTLESRRLQPGRLHILQGIMQVLWHVWKEGDSSLGLLDKNSFVYCKQSLQQQMLLDIMREQSGKRVILFGSNIYKTLLHLSPTEGKFEGDVWYGRVGLVMARCL